MLGRSKSTASTSTAEMEIAPTAPTDTETSDVKAASPDKTSDVKAASPDKTSDVKAASADKTSDVKAASADKQVQDNQEDLDLNVGIDLTNFPDLEEDLANLDINAINQVFDNEAAAKSGPVEVGNMIMIGRDVYNELTKADE